VSETLKQALCEALLLQTPDVNKNFVLVMDASDLAIFAVSRQWVDRVLASILY
jgi:hypothetical protein